MSVTVSPPNSRVSSLRSKVRVFAVVGTKAHVLFHDVSRSHQFVSGILKVFMKRFSRTKLWLQVQRYAAARECTPISLQRLAYGLLGFNDVGQSWWQDFRAGYIEGSAFRLNCLVIHRPIISSG